MIVIKKFHRLMEEVSAEKGEFILFGLFLREESADKWDLVIAAPWLKEGKLKALGEFIKKAKAIVGEEEIIALSRIVTVNPGDPFVEDILRSVPVVDEPAEIRDMTFSGLEIKHAYILRAAHARELETLAT